MASFPDEVHVLRNRDIIIALDAKTGVVSTGGQGKSGAVKLNDEIGNLRTTLDENSIVLRAAPVPGASLGAEAVKVSGAKSAADPGGHIEVKAGSNHTTVAISGAKSAAEPGGHINVKDGSDHITVTIDGTRGYIGVGGAVEGQLALFPGPALNNIDKANIHLGAKEGFIRVGGAGAGGGNIYVYGATNSENPPDVHKPHLTAAIRIDGAAGDIKLINADCAEDFEIADSGGDVDPGTVMVICDNGELRRSEREYDKRVAGVISGANDLRPGIILGKKAASATHRPVALTGQVYCKVDANYSAVEVGDLLTTSPTPGHAMSARDPCRSFGAVIGKALSPLNGGQGLVRILVALQ